MNNHYGMSRVFGKARCKMPMNLQYFAVFGRANLARKQFALCITSKAVTVGLVWTYFPRSF